MRILLLKYRNIGDVVLSSALISNLKYHYPKSCIDFALNKECEPILKNNHNVTNLIPYDRERNREMGFFKRLVSEIRTIRSLRQRKYDLAINLTEGDRGTLYVFFSGAKMKVGFPSRNFFLSKINIYDLTAKDNLPLHTAEKDLQFITLLDKDICNFKNEVFWSKADKFSLKAKIPNLGAKFAVVHPVSRWMFKCWDDKKMAQNIDFLQKEKGYQVYITGSNSHIEIQRINKILNLCNVKPVNLSGKLSLNELSYLINKANFFFGIDSAPMHIAAACNKVVFAIFGASYPSKWGPWLSGSKNFQDIDGPQTNGRDFIFSNMNHDIFYENGTKRSRGMSLITFDSIRKLINENLE